MVLHQRHCVITTPKKTNRPSFSARDEKLLTYTAKKKLNTSGDNSVLRVKTRGQPLYFARSQSEEKFTAGFKYNGEKERHTTW